MPTYRAPRASTPPVIDGVLDDAIWSQTTATERFVNTMTGAPAAPETTARIAWDDEFLYVAFEVDDPYVRAEGEGHDPHLWEQDTVELMIDPDGDGLNYYELQLSPTGAVFDTRYDSRRVPQPFGHVDWDSGLVGRARVEGTANDDEDDHGYVAEMKIPWTAFQEGAPAAGDTWRLALYVLDAVREGQRGVGWSPPMVGDFHVPDRFGHLAFE